MPTGDGEADFYENFNNDGPLTLQRHEFVMGLETDAEGNFYYCRSGHYILSKKGKNCCVMKVSRDGRKLEVFARGLREPNGLSIGPDGTMTVADNEGNGIPPAELDSVFDKFYRAEKGDHVRPGTGLGLAISRGFVEAMHGSIVAANRTDRAGAVLTIRLPVPADAKSLDSAA